jgi:hypothetical protein
VANTRDPTQVLGTGTPPSSRRSLASAAVAFGPIASVVASGVGAAALGLSEALPICGMGNPCSMDALWGGAVRPTPHFRRTVMLVITGNETP